MMQEGALTLHHSHYMTYVAQAGLTNVRN